jgi:hypothetical protein
MVLLASIFLQQALSEPSSGNIGSDLVIVLACLGILTGMVYLFKFVLEKCGVARRKDMISSAFSEKENP